MSDAPERIVARVDYDGEWDGQWCELGREPIGIHAYHHAEYVRADLGSFYQEKDIDALQGEIARLKSAVRGLLNCPHIVCRDTDAYRDTDMDWDDPETEAAVEKAWQALGETPSASKGEK